MIHVSLICWFRNLARAARRSTVVCGTLLAMFGGSLSSRALATPILIDDFSHGTSGAMLVVLVAGNNEPSSANLSHLQLQKETVVNHILGGERDLLLAVQGTKFSNSMNAMLGHDTSANLNYLSVATANQSPSVVSLQYDGVDNGDTQTVLSNGHGLSENFTSGGNNQFELKFAGAQSTLAAGLDMMIVVTSAGGKSSTFSTNITNNHSGITVDAPFTSFIQSGGASGAANFAAADSVTFLFNSSKTPGVDFTLLSIKATGGNPVPEPASWTLLATGIALLALVARRRLV